MQYSNLTIGYVLKKFPRLSETFILNELLQLEKLGINIIIFSIKNPFDTEDSVISHKYLKQLKAKVIYLPNKRVLKNSKIKILDPASDTIKEQSIESIIDDPDNEDNKNHIRASAIASICTANNITHLHSHFGTASNVAMQASLLANISFSFTTHAKDIYKNDVNYGDLGLKINKSEFVITVSEYNKAFLGNKFKTDDHKIIRLYNGIDLHRFSKDSNKTNANNKDIVLAVGRLEMKKGFEFLIESARILKNKLIDFKCLIVGDGSQRSNLESLIDLYDLSNHVELLGSNNQEQIIELLYSSNVFVLPSIIDDSGDRDVLPTVLIEAMAMKVPVISTKVSAIPEIIENNISGILVEQKDPEKLAESIQILLENPELQLEFSESGRKRVESLFDIEKNAPKLAKLFEQAINKKDNKIAV